MSPTYPEPGTDAAVGGTGTGSTAQRVTEDRAGITWQAKALVFRSLTDGAHGNRNCGFWGLHRGNFSILQRANKEPGNHGAGIHEAIAESQRETYRQALTAAATIANTDDSNAKQQAVRDFWRLYQGAMILVETETVKDAMIRYGYCLEGIDKCDKYEMNTRCHDLASAMAESMAATAGMTYREFASKQFKYSPGTRVAPAARSASDSPDSSPASHEKSGGK